MLDIVLKGTQICGHAFDILFKISYKKVILTLLLI